MLPQLYSTFKHIFIEDSRLIVSEGQTNVIPVKQCFLIHIAWFPKGILGEGFRIGLGDAAILTKIAA
jgi:hypothetical protein